MCTQPKNGSGMKQWPTVRTSGRGEHLKKTATVFLEIKQNKQVLLLPSNTFTVKGWTEARK
jgi:hypothetical protein